MYLYFSAKYIHIYVCGVICTFPSFHLPRCSLPFLEATLRVGALHAARKYCQIFVDENAVCVFVFDVELVHSAGLQISNFPFFPPALFGSRAERDFSAEDYRYRNVASEGFQLMRENHYWKRCRSLLFLIRRPASDEVFFCLVRTARRQTSTKLYSNDFAVLIDTLIKTVCREHAASRLKLMMRQ